MVKGKPPPITATHHELQQPAISSPAALSEHHHTHITSQRRKAGDPACQRSAANAHHRFLLQKTRTREEEAQARTPSAIARASFRSEGRGSWRNSTVAALGKMSRRHNAVADGRSGKMQWIARKNHHS